jgi:hypothetical protein
MKKFNGNIRPGNQDVQIAECGEYSFRPPLVGEPGSALQPPNGMIYQQEPRPGYQEPRTRYDGSDPYVPDV